MGLFLDARRRGGDAAAIRRKRFVDAPPARAPCGAACKALTFSAAPGVGSPRREATKPRVSSDRGGVQRTGRDRASRRASISRRRLAPYASAPSRTRAKQNELLEVADVWVILGFQLPVSSSQLPAPAASASRGR